jgi:hypothetical protein
LLWFICGNVCLLFGDLDLLLFLVGYLVVVMVVYGTCSCFLGVLFGGGFVDCLLSLLSGVLCLLVGDLGLLLFLFVRFIGGEFVNFL